MRRWLQTATYLLACSRFGTNPAFLEFLSRFGTKFLRPMRRKEAVWSVDGRTGHQIIESVKAYLDWRAGTCWKPLRLFGDEQYEYYIGGFRTLITAWLKPEPIAEQSIAELNAEAVRLGLPVAPLSKAPGAQPIPFPVKPAYKPKRRAA